MGNLLGDGLRWLEDQRRAHMTQTVTYIRGAGSVELLATIGQTEFAAEIDGQLVTSKKVRDFLVTAADLVIAGSAIEPRAGDRIRETSEGRMLEWEVAAIGGEPPWRWADSNRLTYRMHANHVATTDAP